MTSGVSEPVKEVIRDALRQMRLQYREARIAALVAGPFGTRVWEAMRRLEPPSFLAYPRMLAHPKTVLAYNNPDGDGAWLRTLSEAEERLSELEQWELHHVYRNERIAMIGWWTLAATVLASALGSYALGRETLSVAALIVLLSISMLSVAGAVLGDVLKRLVVERSRTQFEVVASELPGRLWTAMERGHPVR